MKSKQEILDIARRTLDIEAESLLKLKDFITNDFAEAVQKIYECKGRLIITGIGKSANVGNKIVATLNSTGTPAIFMHAADAIHGDLGALLENDIVLCISNSGNSPEIKELIPFIQSRGNIIIAIVGNQEGYLARNANYVINSYVEKEACTNNLAPTSSTTAQMALGDAIAVALIEMRNFTSEDFAKSHPGGALGKRLYLTIDNIIQRNEKPNITSTATLQEVIYEISSKRLGAVAVTNSANEVVGMITDGDIRRMIGSGKNIQELTAKDIMGSNPKTILIGSLAVDCLKMIRKNNITQVIAVDSAGIYKGMVHLHDLIKEGISE